MFNQTDAAYIYIRINHIENIGSDYIRDIIQIVNYVIIMEIICLFGTVTNVINLLVFYVQGLDTTINISFFALAVSDLCSLIMQQCYNVLVNPWFEKLGVPGVTSGIQFIIAGVPRECFARITFLITVYITAERCFCITYPLHVKQMITPSRTAFVMFAIHSFTFLSVVPLYYTTYIEWKFYPERNITLLGLAFTRDKDRLEGIVMIIHALSGALSFLAVVIFTAILIKKLGQKSAFRKSASSESKQNVSMTNRDRKTIALVVLIATILIVSYTPSVVLFIVTFTEPEFSAGGKYSNLYIGGWSFAWVFECINSSVNIFLYFKMSTKFRDTLRELCPPCTNVLHKGKTTLLISINE